MAVQFHSRWRKKRRFAIERGEAVSLAHGSGLPINLKSVAIACKVKKIEFRPMLVEGAIAVEEDGFSIFISSGDRDAGTLNLLFTEDGTGRLLPAEFRNRARFSIAHEIAHTFFYSTESGSAEMSISIEHEASVRSLETACNLAAAAILVPEIVLKRRFSRSDWLSPDTLVRIANNALVSKQALIERIRSLRSFEHPYGIMAAVERTKDGCKILGASVHYAMSDTFRDDLHGKPLTDLLAHPDFALCGGELEEVCESFAFANGDRDTVVFSTEPSAVGRKIGTFFLTMKRPIKGG
jgi:hypothetical protein